MQLVSAILAGLVGLLLGGVINGLADDLPARRSPGRPHYPDGTPRPPSAWLGLTAFLTGQRAPAAPTAGAGTKPARLSWRHPLVEIGLALGFAAMVLGFYGERRLVVWLAYAAVLLLITVIDIEHRLILFVVMVPACLFALIVALVLPEPDRPFWDYLLGGALGFGLFFFMFLGGNLFSAATHNEEVAFGFGDVMLATLSGLMLGWRAFIFASLITVFAGAFGALIYLLGRAMLRRRYQWFTPLPYGPYIVIGTLIMLLFREDVQRILRGG